MKKCFSCKKAKSLDQFYHSENFTNKDKHSSSCKECVCRRATQWALDNPERVRMSKRKYNKEYRKRPEIKVREKEYQRKYYLKHRINIRKKAARFDILQRDNFTCQYCGRKPPEVKLQIDHKIPQSKEKNNTNENLITACSDCNLGKGDRLLNSYTT